MSKKQTNQQQFAALVDFAKELEKVAQKMISVPEFKNVAKHMWDGVREILNSLGPPIRTTDGWKKVWKDYKYHVKYKVRRNMQCIKDSDSDNLIAVTPLEEEVIALYNIRNSESGEMGKKFDISWNQIPFTVENDDELVSSSATPSEIEIKIESMSPNELKNEYDDMDYDNSSTLHSEDFKTLSNEHNYDQPISHKVNTEDVDILFEEVDVDLKPRQRTRVPIKSTSRLLQLQIKKQNKFFMRTITLMEKQNRLLTRQNRELRMQTEEMKKSRHLQEQEVSLLKRQIELKEAESF